MKIVAVPTHIYTFVTCTVDDGTYVLIRSLHHWLTQYCIIG